MEKSIIYAAAWAGWLTRGAQFGPSFPQKFPHWRALAVDSGPSAPNMVPARSEKRPSMPRPSFTWTIASNHVIQSVCDRCARMVAASPRPDLLLFIERDHQCAEGQILALARMQPGSVGVRSAG